LGVAYPNRLYQPVNNNATFNFTKLFKSSKIIEFNLEQIFKMNLKLKERK
jgi:hypothetical protein